MAYRNVHILLHDTTAVCGNHLSRITVPTDLLCRRSRTPRAELVLLPAILWYNASSLAVVGAPHLSNGAPPAD